jgi:hypothetical protein
MEGIVPKRKVRTGAKKSHKKEAQVQLFNKKWFIDKLADHQISQRQLAARMALDPAAMNRTFKGARRMQLDEAASIARVIGVPVEEVMVHAGIDTRGTITKAGRVPVMGWLDKDFNVHTDGIRGERFVASLPHDAPGLEAFRLQTANTPADALDGNLVYYRPGNTVSPGAIGRWCVVTRLDGRVQVRVLKPGYRRGTYNLSDPMHGSTEEDVVLESAAPVVRMEF